MTEQPTETFLQKQLRLKRERETAARPTPATGTLPATYLGPKDDLWQRRAAGWCQVALDKTAIDIAKMAPDTGRNSEYSRQLWRFLRYAHAGHLNLNEVLTTMRDAATRCGLPTHEIDATERSAIRQAHTDGPVDPELIDNTFGIPIEPFSDVSPFALDPGETDPPPHDPAAELSAKIRAALPLLDWHALWADQDEEEWIVEPILPARRLIALYSAPKLGKSLLMLEIAVAVATGTQVLGVTPDRPRRVLYVDFENDPKADVRQRLQDMHRSPDQLGNLCYLSFPTLAALDSERGGLELMAAVREYECEVVVVDTVSRSIAGEENENDTWLAFYRHTGLALKQAGISLVRLDHSGKDETKGQRGGSAKSGDVDAVWRLSRVADETYRLDCEAARMPVTEKTLVIHRETGPLRHRVDAAGRSAAVDIKVQAIIKVLDDLGEPNDIGPRRTRDIARERGIKARNELFATAAQKRAQRVPHTLGTQDPDGRARAAGAHLGTDSDW